MTNDRPRYTSIALPPYSYVPGHFPHPVSDPGGHMYGQIHEEVNPLQSEAWQASEEYCYGIDLFNHGFYWESHEAWESLWHVAGRKGRMADFLKGLIKLAAAGVKVREGNPRGVERHARRSIELLSTETESIFCGLSLLQPITFAETLIQSIPLYNESRPTLLLSMALTPT